MGESRSRRAPVCLSVADHLAERDGVITLGEACDLGMTRDEVRRKTSRGLWTPHARGVYLSAEHRMTDMARLRIATAAHRGTADRTAAAWLHGLLRDLPTSVTVSVPRSGHGAADCAIPVSTKRRTFSGEDLSEVAGVSVVGIPLAILQTVAEIDPDSAVSMVDRALQINRVTLRALRASLDRNCGAHGMRVARIVLASAEDESESEAERLFVRLLRRYGIGGWRQQQWLGGHRIDFVWPELQVAVSIHGWAFHHQYERWDNDQRTANTLAAMGWYPLSFPWQRLKFEEEAVMRELSAVLDSRHTVR